MEIKFEEKKEEEKKSFPVILESDNKKDIVLFFEPGIGIVIKSSQYETGHFSESWAFGNFKKQIHGKITFEL